MSATVSEEPWATIYHTTLFRFSREARTQVLHELREARNRPSENYTYDTVQHHFEITCLLADGEDAETDLTRIITSFLQGEESKSNEFADYARKAVKFPYAFVDEESPFADGEASEQDLSFADDDLINLEDHPKETSWTPLHASLPLDRIASVHVLNAVASGTSCRLSLDIAKHRVVIAGARGARDVEAVKRRLSNLEALDINKVSVIHTLKANRQEELELHFLRLHEKTEGKKGFNEDMTLTKLLMPGDAPFFRGYRDEVRGKALQQLYVLRPYKVEPFPDTAQPIKNKIQPYKDAASKPVTSLLSRMKLRSVGRDAPTSVKTEVLPAPGLSKVENWMNNVARVEPPSRQQQPTQPGAITEHQMVERTKPDMKGVKRIPVEAPTSTTTQPRNPASTSFASALQSTKAIYTPDNALPAASPAAPTARAEEQWNPSRPPRSAWQPTQRPERSRPQGRHSNPKPTQGGVQRHKVSEPLDRKSTRESDQAQRKPPAKPTAKPVASSNPFAGLQDEDGDDDEDADDSDEQHEQDNSISERLATDDDPPPRLRANRQKAPGPPPKAFSQLSGTASGKDSSTESANGSTDATSIDSMEAGSTFIQTLQNLKATDREQRVGSAYMRNALTSFHSSLEPARALQGSLEIKVELGKVVVSNPPSDARKDIPAKSFENKLKQFPGFDSANQSFVKALTTSSNDVDSLLESVGVSDKTTVIHESAYLELTCVRSDKSTTRIVIDVLDREESLSEPFAKSPETILGYWYSHHPQRFWDSRIALTSHTKYPLSDNDGAATFVEHLSVRHKPEMPGPNVSGRNDESLHVQAVHFYSTARWPLVAGWSTAEDVVVEIRRVLDFPIYLKKDDSNSTMGLFLAPCLSEEEMIRDQRLWFEVSLVLANPSHATKQNEPFPDIKDPACMSPDQGTADSRENKELEPYEKAEWKPEDVLSAEQLLALHEVASRLVEKMDGVGAKNKGFGAEREARLKRERVKLESTPDQFW